MGIDAFFGDIFGKKKDRMPPLRETGADTENIVELSPEKLTYSGLIKFIALKVIKEQGGQITKDLPWLANESPVLRLHKYLQRTKNFNEINATAIAAGGLSAEMEGKLFDISWDEFTDLANANNEIFKGLLKKSVPLIRNYVAKVKDKASRQFELTFITDRIKALKHAKKESGGVPEEDTILGEKGVYWQQVDWKNKESNPEERIQNIQLALGSALVHTLRNQRNIAGHLDGKMHQVQAGYQDKIASYFTKLDGHPPRLQFTGWDEICGGNEKLKALLKEKFSVIDEFSDTDCNDQFGYFPSGQTSPEINHPDFLSQGFAAFKVRIFHRSGRFYSDTNILDFFQADGLKLDENIRSQLPDGDGKLTWKYLKDLSSQPDKERWVPYSVSIDLSPTISSQVQELHHVAHSLSVTTDKIDDIDHLRWKSGHFSIDGAAQDESVKMFTQYLGSNEVRPTRDFIENNHVRDNIDVEQIRAARSTGEILELLNLRDVIIGHIYDSSKLKNSTTYFRGKGSTQRLSKIDEYLRDSPEINSQIRLIYHQYANLLFDKYPRQSSGKKEDQEQLFKHLHDIATGDILDQINFFLNPATAGVDALAMASEDTAHTTVCALPVSPLRRLGTYIVNKVDKNFHSLSKSFALTASQRVLTKLGLGIQSFISVGLADVAPIARILSGPLSKILKEKVLSEVQISDLGPHKNFFVTAGSAIIPELGEVIGVAGDFLTARIDFRKEGIIEKLDITSAFTKEDLEALHYVLPIKPKSSIFTPEEVSLRATNQLLDMLHTERGQVTPYEVLKYIAVNSDNPAKAISIWLTAKAYIDLVNIPKRAIKYLDEAAAEDMNLPFAPTGNV